MMTLEQEVVEDVESGLLNDLYLLDMCTRAQFRLWIYSERVWGLL